MSMLRPMRDELFKYRKRKKRAIDGSVPGVPYTRYRKSRRYVSGLPYVPRGPSHHHNLYNWVTPREYHPSLNAPAVQETEYDPYEPMGVHHVSRPNNPRLPHDLNDSSQDISIPISLPEDDLPLTEQFLISMGKRDEIEQVVPEEPLFNINEQNLSESIPIESQLSVEERDIDELPSLEELRDTFLVLVKALPDDHPDLVNVRTAMHKVLNHQISLSETTETEMDPIDFYSTGMEMEIDPFQLDPYQEAEQFFNKQMEILDKAFDDQTIGPDKIEVPNTFENQAMEPDMILNGALPDEPFIEEQSLEEIVDQENPFEAPAPEFMEQDMMFVEMESDMEMTGAMPELTVFDIDPAIDEINQAIDQAIEQPMPQEIEPEPFQPQYDSYTMDQNMFDEMQYMADPFAMPGPCGPMGPMPSP